MSDTKQDTATEAPGWNSAETAELDTAPAKQLADDITEFMEPVEVPSFNANRDGDTLAFEIASDDEPEITAEAEDEILPTMEFPPVDAEESPEEIPADESAHESREQGTTRNNESSDDNGQQEDSEADIEEQSDNETPSDKDGADPRAEVEDDTVVGDDGETEGIADGDGESNDETDSGDTVDDDVQAGESDDLTALDTSAPKLKPMDLLPYGIGVIAGTAAGCATHWFLNAGQLPWTVIATQFAVALVVMAILFAVLSHKDKVRREDIGEAVSAYDEQLAAVKEGDPELYEKLIHPEELTDSELDSAMTELGRKFPDVFAALIEAQETITGFESDIEIPEPEENDVDDFARGTMAEASDEDAGEEDDARGTGSVETIGTGGDVKRGTTGEIPVIQSGSTDDGEVETDVDADSLSALNKLELALFGMREKLREVDGVDYEIVAKGTIDALAAEILVGENGSVSLCIDKEIVGTSSNAEEFIETIAGREQSWDGRTEAGQPIVAALSKKRTRGFYAIQIAKKEETGDDVSACDRLYEDAFGEPRE